MHKEDYTQTAYAPLLLEQEAERKNAFRHNYRLILKTPAELWEESTENLQYQSNKWGGKYLNAPEILFKILNKGEEKDLVDQIQNYVTGERYLNTGGADGFFIITDFKKEGKYIHFKNASTDKSVKASEQFEGKLSESYFRPLIKNALKKTKTILVQEPDALCFVEKSSNNLNTLEYVKWGEVNNYNKKSVTQYQKPWYKPTRQMLQGAEDFGTKKFWGNICDTLQSRKTYKPSFLQITS